MVISWQLLTQMCFLAFSHQYLHNFPFQKPPTAFLTYFCRAEWQKYARKFVSSGDRTHNHQVMSQTCSLRSHPVRAGVLLTSTLHNILLKPLAAFALNHCGNNGQWSERNESCSSDLSSILGKDIC